MSRHILIVQGHPDPQPGHFCHALAEAYDAGAVEAGHAVARVPVAALDFPLLRTKAAWATGAPPPDIAAAQDAIRRADHLVFLYPLWLGGMPALLKGFLEQVARPGFAVEPNEHGLPRGLLGGKSARIVVTMGMPAAIYRWYFRAHALRSLERNVLGLSGIRPVRATLVGGVDAMNDVARRTWLRKLRALGHKAQ
ncbi:MAG TPA: NAD(P)H-dependent oxidoreductase [Candidatus Sulfotelmatobacter sp.]|nr:NAD(P)H-dependent oxidoreductase [Candidatus Sulfotelmatobacter sp.]